MFGYVRIDKPELRVKDAAYYKSVYCSLCQEIGKNYGLVYRYFVSYDMTFLCIVVNALENSENIYRYRCPFNPLGIKGKIYIDSKVLKYAAYMNYHMVLYKLQDNIQDDHSILSRILYWILIHNPKYQKRKNLFNTAKLDAALDQLYRNEDQNHSFDELTDLFGQYLVCMLESYGKSYPQEVYDILYLLGKWIYMIDGYDDYEKDQKENHFNLLETMSSQENLEEQVENMHNLLLDWMMDAFEQVEWNNHDELIYNILFLNTTKTFENLKMKKQSL